MNIEEFDPDAPGQDNGNYFGFPFTPDESRLVLLSVPWDVTASYGEGACYAPDAIIGESTQLDFYDPTYPDGWREGIATLGIDYSIQDRSIMLREEAKKVMKHLSKGGSPDDEIAKRRMHWINEASAVLNRSIRDEAAGWLDKGKIVGLVGGDHSAPFGLIEALSEREGPVSVLHIDAHADLREAYEGFTDSHASIMYNVISRLSGVERLVQVGVRDFSRQEAEFARENPRVEMFTDYELAAAAFRGDTWDGQCGRIAERLGENVYISFDIDGLSPDNAPSTGTPVPGGLSFNRAVYLIDKVVASGRRIVGFDICEVSPSAGGRWDANVGARILYKLCMFALKSNKGRG